MRNQTIIAWLGWGLNEVQPKERRPPARAKNLDSIPHHGGEQDRYARTDPDRV